MKNGRLEIDYWPKTRSPFFIAGFEGWGNALDVSNAMINYLVRKLGAKKFATLVGDIFYRFDETRPWVQIEDGQLKSIDPPHADFYHAELSNPDHDMILLRAPEPHVRWLTFVDDVLSVCKQMNVHTIITLGSMYDNVLHSDVVISAMASESELMEKLGSENIIPINYQGPSAIHSLFHSKGQEMGFVSVSLWCHCPYFLQGTTHFGLLSALGDVLSKLCGFKLDKTELNLAWKELSKQIDQLIAKNPDLQRVVQEMRKAKIRGSWKNISASAKRGDKIIHLEDFLRPK